MNPFLIDMRQRLKILLAFSTFPVQNSHVQVRVAVKGLQLLQQTPRCLLVHRVTHLWAVYCHGNHGSPSL